MHCCPSAGCLAGQPSYAGDWAREGVRVSMVKTGDDNSCSRYVTLEMVDELRFHSNPWVESLAIIVNVSGCKLSITMHFDSESGAVPCWATKVPANTKSRLFQGPVKDGGRVDVPLQPMGGLTGHHCQCSVC
jgi:hypothetical protein